MKLEKSLDRKRSEEAPMPKSEQTGPSNIDLENPHLVDGKYSIRDLIDIESLRKTLEKFSLATGFTTGFLEYPSQDILVATGWRDICTKFHRAVPESAKHCKESNIYLTTQLKKLKELNIKPCENGLVDGATPIVIKGKFIAYLATGQVLFEEPDIERFKKQAEIYGYDVDAYIEALSKVPVVSEEQFKKALSFLSEIAEMIGETGLNNLELKEKTRELERDITERKRVELDLLKSEEQYRRLFDSLVDVFYQTDSKGKLTMVSPSIIKTTGWEPEEVIGLDLKDFYVNPEERDTFLDIIARNGFVENYEVQMKAKDGSAIWVSVSARLNVDKAGNVLGTEGIARDITKLKQDRESMAESEKRYRLLYKESKQREQLYESLLNSAPDAVAIYNLKDDITYINPAFIQTFGFTLGDVQEKRMPFVPEIETAQTRAVIEQVLRGESVSGLETKRLTKDGSTLDISLSASCYNDHKGKPAGIVVFGSVNLIV